MPIAPLKVLPPPPPVTQGVDSRQFRDWFYTIFSQTNGNIDQLGTMAFENSNDVNITGGSLAGVDLSSFKTPGLVGYLKGNGSSSVVSASSTVPWSDVSNQPHIEAYDSSATYPVTSTPTILKPASTVAGSSGITYSASTGIFTFANAGSYSLALNVNAIASAASQSVYIYAENNTGSGWVVNANSGKSYQLANNQLTQIVYAQAVSRVAGQQVRYYIYSNDGKVQLETFTLPGGVGAIVPAIRIQYS